MPSQFKQNIRNLVSAISLGIAIACLIVATGNDNITCGGFPDGQTTMVVDIQISSPDASGNGTGVATLADPSGLIKNIGLKKWLITFGAVGVAVIPLVIIGMVCIICGQREDGEAGAGAGLGMCVLCLVILSGLFRFCWICVGAALLWGNCKGDVGPEPVNRTMMTAVIFSFIEIALNCLCQDRQQKEGGGGGVGLNSDY